MTLMAQVGDLEHRGLSTTSELAIQKWVRQVRRVSHVVLALYQKTVHRALRTVSSMMLMAKVGDLERRDLSTTNELAGRRNMWTSSSLAGNTPPLGR